MDKKPLKVLFADDAPAVSKRLAELLSDLPVEVVATAADGEEALRLFEQTSPDIMVLDLQMPKKNGIQVVSEVRKAGSKALLVILTNLDTPEFFERARRAGADHFLSKRIQFSKIRAIVENHLRTHARA